MTLALPWGLMMIAGHHGESKDTSGMLGQEAARLSRHMGHSLETNYEFYQATVVPKDSIASFVKICTLGKWKPGRRWMRAIPLHPSVKGGLTSSNRRFIPTLQPQLRSGSQPALNRPKSF